MKLADIRPAKGATHAKKRLGKGRGTGTGGTAGKGHKGHQARSGGQKISVWHEGGQMPLQRRLPKRGFTNIHAAAQQIVNIGRLEKYFDAGAVIDIAALAEKRLVRSVDVPVKLLAGGDDALSRAYTIRVHAASAAAREKVAAAGGTVEILG